MKKSIKTLSSITLAFMCVVGLSGCKEEAKKINFEENYETVQTAALSMNNFEDSVEGYFIDTKITMKMSASGAGSKFSSTQEIDTWVNHIGDNYYTVSDSEASGKNGVALEKQQDGSYIMYTWSEDYEVYYKEVVDTSSLEDYLEEFRIDESNMGILKVFQDEFTELDANVSLTINDLEMNEMLEDLEIDLSALLSLYDVEYYATELKGIKTFTIDIDFEETSNMDMDVKYSLSVKDDKVEKVSTEVMVEMEEAGVSSKVTMIIDQELVEKAKTDSKYKSIPQNVTWQEW